MMYRIIFMSLLCAAPLLVSAQKPARDSLIIRRDSLALQGDDAIRERPEGTQRPTQLDTVASEIYLTPGGFYTERGSFHDTLDAHYHHYDPARQGDFPYANLGNLGTAARRMYFMMPQTTGINFGHQAYDLYKIDFDNFKFYDSDVPLTRFYYSQGLDQKDGIFSAEFGRNFQKGFNLSLDYQRINQRGRYAEQRTKNTLFGVGVLYRSPKGRWDGIYHYLSNVITAEDNGGVDLLALDTIDLQINVPVILEDALTTHRQREFTIQHHVHLLSANDSTSRRKANIDLIHLLRFGSSFVKFADANLQADELTYYEGYVTDDRGVRNFMFMRTFQTGLDIQFRYLNNKPDIPAQILRAGLMYRNAKVDQEPENFTQRELYLTAAAQIGISRHISLDGKGYLGILDAGGEFRLEANARLSLFKDARTWAQWVIYQRQPNLTESRLFISQQPVWNFDFNNLALSSLSFHYDHPSLRLKLHGGFHLISNLIYYDEQRIPQQLGSTAEVLQLSAQKEFVFGPLGVMGHLMFQEYDADQIALPHLIFTGQIFYTGKWFKQRLLVRTGLDVLVTDTYQGVSYFPVTGQFYYNPAFDIAQYPAVDAFFSLQVRDFFKAFAKLENVTAYLTDDHFVEVAGYPHFETYFRFGLWMRLFN